MLKEEVNQRLIDLVQNEEFTSKLENAKTDEQILNLLSQYEIEMTMEELADAKNAGRKLLEEQKIQTDGELSEETLEQVAGGIRWSRFLVGSLICAAGAATGQAGAAVLGAAIAYWGWKS
jgi:hypothetical protein